MLDVFVLVSIIFFSFNSCIFIPNDLLWWMIFLHSSARSFGRYLNILLVIFLLLYCFSFFFFFFFLSSTSSFKSSSPSCSAESLISSLGFRTLVSSMYTLMISTILLSLRLKHLYALILLEYPTNMPLSTQESNFPILSSSLLI
jgi:hypothetical protein